MLMWAEAKQRSSASYQNEALSVGIKSGTCHDSVFEADRASGLSATYLMRDLRLRVAWIRRASS